MRKCLKIPIREFLRDFERDYRAINVSRVNIYVDVKNWTEIYAFLKSNKRKLARILYVALQGKYDKDLYRKEEVSKKAKGVTAMKFSGKLNGRIYCKEFEEKGTKKIVLVEYLPNKDFQSANSHKLKPRLETIGELEYEYIEQQ